MEDRRTVGCALVVGAPAESLKAVERDARAIAELLGKRGFEVECCIGAQATRDGILAGYDRLIARAQPGEPAVFYYSGHGFEARVNAGPISSCQGISPVDADQSTSNDFLGITTWELSIKLAELTRRTRNVTVILDCCYAAQMSRTLKDAGVIPRALPHPDGAGGIPAHIQALRDRYGAGFEALDPLGNPDAVRLVACKREGCAYEYPTSDGEYRGVFTEALVEMLREVEGVSLSWAAIDEALRGRVQDRVSVQQPTIEGPSRRVMFSLHEQDDLGDAVLVVDMGNGLQLQAGQLMGVARDDVYAMMPPGVRTVDPDHAIAEVRVRDVTATTAELDVVSRKDGVAKLPSFVIAGPIATRGARHAVTIDVPAEARGEVEDRIVATRRLRAATPADADVLATLRLDGGVLTIEDEGGALYPEARFPHELPSAVESLVSLGTAQRLRSLEGEHGVLSSEVEIEWGTVVAGEMRAMPARGCTLNRGDRIYVRIRTTTQRWLFAHAFNIGLCNTVDCLTSYAPVGDLLTAERPEIVIGRRPDGTLPGLRVSWPDGLPRDAAPGVDEVVVVITAVRANLRRFETSAQRGAVRHASSKLKSMQPRPGDALARSTNRQPEDDGFLVQRLAYLLDP